MSDADVVSIFKSTLNQSENPIWFEQRKGRLTASNFKRILTRYNSLERDPSQSCESLIRDLTLMKPKVTTYAVKHGLALEPHAKLKLQELFSHHKNMQFVETGLYVMKDHPYIGASADGILKCDCCGTFLVEIKCPLFSKR